LERVCGDTVKAAVHDPKRDWGAGPIRETTA